MPRLGHSRLTKFSLGNARAVKLRRTCFVRKRTASNKLLLETPGRHLPSPGRANQVRYSTPTTTSVGTHPQEIIFLERCILTNLLHHVSSLLRQHRRYDVDRLLAASCATGPVAIETASCFATTIRKSHRPILTSRQVRRYIPSLTQDVFDGRTNTVL